MPILRVPDGKGGYSEIPALVGPAGKDGKDGAQGVKGDKGDKGDTGAQGLKGDPGTPGTKGDKGDTGAQGLQGVQGPPGDPGKDAEPVVIIGPGRPDVPSTTGGKITGSEPVGSEYRSTDSAAGSASAGARVWLYDGAKWRVVDGDTGWRDVTASSQIADLKDGSVCIRRVNNTVLFRYSPTFKTTVSTPLGRMMQGFAGFEAATTGGVVGWAARYSTAVPLFSGSGTPITGRFLSYSRSGSGSSRGDLYVSGGTGAITEPCNAALMWATDDSWPATLPGQPNG